MVLTSKPTFGDTAAMNRHALDRAVKAAGGRKALAASLGVSESTVDKWATRERFPRPAKIIQIEAMYGIPREQLMPSLFRRAVV
jgi:DNA-binding transcriptional regulator YdaS (Cro superfamily)